MIHLETTRAGLWLAVAIGLLAAGCGGDGPQGDPTDPVGPQLPECNQASDCLGRIGCDEGCTCNADHECVAASCSSDVDCSAPESCCDPATHRCQLPTCSNGGVVCTAPDTECSSDGKCVPPTKPVVPPPPVPPGACQSDKDCCPYLASCAKAVEHCEIPKGAASGSCQPGCRSHDSCEKIGLDSCNGLFQCIEGGKQGDPCDDGYPKKDLDDCRYGYYCCPVMKQCFETCKTPGETCPDTGKQCVWWPTGPKCLL